MMEGPLDRFFEAAERIQSFRVAVFVIAIDVSMDALVLLCRWNTRFNRAAFANQFAVIDTVFCTVVLFTMQFATEVLQEAHALDS